MSGNSAGSPTDLLSPFGAASQPEIHGLPATSVTSVLWRSLMTIDPFDHSAAEPAFLALLGSPTTPLEVWAGFLAFAEQPLQLRVDEHPDNDLLFFTAEDQTPDRTRLITLQRRIGLCVPPFDYCGTALAACWLQVRNDGPWDQATLAVNIEGHGASAGAASDVAAFRATVEASDAFAALSASSLVRHVASLGWA